MKIHLLGGAIYVLTGSLVDGYDEAKRRLSLFMWKRQKLSLLDQTIVQVKTTMHTIKSYERLNGWGKRLQKLFRLDGQSVYKLHGREVTPRRLLSIALRELATGNIFWDRNFCLDMFTAW